ncbi:MAG: hypothetical protein HYX55_01245 [Chloroflexi bacterium]|nr:hypothetical protein [Chloroflexota bacterium]
MPEQDDLSAIPSFLRSTPQRRATAAPDAAKPARPAYAMPRPVTPQAASPVARQEPALDPASLPMPSLSRRRVVTAAGVLLAGVLILSFARQVSEATAASSRAVELRTTNAALRDEVARLERDLGHVQDVRFIRLAGRAFGLGGPHEIPFALAAGAPPLAADAPGSASVRLGAVPRPRSPLDAWLEVLFGAGR